MKEALDELEDEEDDDAPNGTEELAPADGSTDAATVKPVSDGDFFVGEEGDEDEADRFHSASDEVAPPSDAGAEEGGSGIKRAASSDSQGSFNSGVESVDERRERASQIDPATVEWKLEEMIWIRREFDGMGMDQATYHMLAGAMHWKKRCVAHAVDV